MSETVIHIAPASNGGLTRQPRVRGAFFNLLERLILALETIAECGSQGHTVQKGSCQVMTYEEAEIALNTSKDLLGKMVKDCRFRQGRHYIKIGTNVRFAKNLADLIFEDQLPLDDTAIVPATAEPQAQISIPGTGIQAPNNNLQTKAPNQNPTRTASKNRAGVETDLTRRAS